MQLNKTLTDQQKIPQINISVLIKQSPLDVCCYTWKTRTMTGLYCCSNSVLASATKSTLFRPAWKKESEAAERLSPYWNESGVVNLPVLWCELHEWQDIPRAQLTHKTGSQHNTRFERHPWWGKGAQGELNHLKKKTKTNKDEAVLVTYWRH